jgi:hypothetical protein
MRQVTILHGGRDTHIDKCRRQDRGTLIRQDWKRLRFAPVIILGVLTFMVADYAIRGPRAREKQSHIERELQLISDPQSSRMTGVRSGFKTSGGYVTRILQTDVPPIEVESHYRKKLEEQEWFSLKEEEILSTRRAIFCNGKDEAAVLALPEKVVPGTYEYSLTMTWNNTEGCK